MALPTPGRITALWVVLKTLQKMDLRAKTLEVLSFASRSGLRSGGLPIDDGLELGLRGGLIMEVDSDLVPGPLGLEALRLCDEEEPSGPVRRLFLSVLTLRDPPPWVAYWQGDPTSLDLILSDADKGMLASAGLYPPGKGEDLLSMGWWRALAVVPIPAEVMAQRKVIGDAGEELSLRFERARLIQEGFPSLADQVWWVARESPAYGFDVASFGGKTFGKKEPEAPLAIEVKSVGYPVRKRFPFHLSVHEWTAAAELGTRHIFHLWNSVRPGPIPTAGSASPLVVRGSELLSHLPGPTSCRGGCQWESVYVELPV